MAPGIDMSSDMCLDMHVDMHVDMCAGMYVDTCVDMYVDVYVDMCVDMCVDMIWCQCRGHDGKEWFVHELSDDVVHQIPQRLQDWRSQHAEGDWVQCHAHDGAISYVNDVTGQRSLFLPPVGGTPILRSCGPTQSCRRAWHLLVLGLLHANQQVEAAEPRHMHLNHW